MADLYRVHSVKVGINHGANKVRFMSLVPAGSRVRMRMVLQEMTEQKPDGFCVIAKCTFELEGPEKPVCVPELITLLFE